MRSPTTATLEKPTPTPPTFQARGGPEAGHSRRRPDSVEIPSRAGPRQPGQSPAAARLAGAPARAQAAKRTPAILRDMADSLTPVPGRTVRLRQVPPV